MILVIPSDFKGEYKVSTDRFTIGDLEMYIAKYTKYYLERLLGKELYDLFDSDLDAGMPQIPQTTRFLEIYNPFTKEDICNLYSSDGMRQMLIKFIYFHYIRDIQYANTVVGTVSSENENSNLAGFNGYNLTRSYNQGVADYKSIQRFMHGESEDYPELKTNHICFTTGI